jgi:hypothetical protein
VTKLRYVEDLDYVILIWTGGLDDVVPNAAGVAVPHVTRMVRGSAVLDVRGFETVTMMPGSEVTIPARTKYKVVGLEDGEVHCFYPKSSPEAMRDINRLRRYVEGTEKVMFVGLTKATLPESERVESVRKETGTITLVPRRM